MEALTASHAANGGISNNPEFSVLQATIKSFLSQAKQVSSTTASAPANRDTRMASSDKKDFVMASGTGLTNTGFNGMLPLTSGENL